ncbi:MAG: hypothetical protein SFY80_01255 [Verrucomicrobiota bacterium]|nr:hypothetical protein [Verrucomicrobiota bacterium]
MVTLNTQIFFEVIQHSAGGFTANCLNADIGTRGTTIQELPERISEVLDRHFRASSRPKDSNVHLLLYRD